MTLSPREREVACDHCNEGLARFDVMEWDRSRSFDHDYYVPVDRGEVCRVPCQLSHSYHFPATNGHPPLRRFYWMGRAPDGAE